MKAAHAARLRHTDEVLFIANATLIEELRHLCGCKDMRCRQGLGRFAAARVSTDQDDVVAKDHLHELLPARLGKSARPPDSIITAGSRARCSSISARRSTATRCKGCAWHISPLGCMAPSRPPKPSFFLAAQDAPFSGEASEHPAPLVPSPAQRVAAPLSRAQWQFKMP